jgi:hypothetical protein
VWTTVGCTHIHPRPLHARLHVSLRVRTVADGPSPHTCPQPRGRAIGYRSHVTAILTLMIVLMLSLVVTRTATVALTATGLSREAARFQARSAFSGAGFTTGESEAVVRHPVRRRIIMWLMLAGNAGIVAVMASIVLAAADSGNEGDTVLRVAAVLGSIYVIWYASRTSWVDRRITQLAEIALRRWTDLDVHDYASLLHVGGEYLVTELEVEPGSWFAGRPLGDLRLRSEGVVVLGIERIDGTYLGVPQADTVAAAGDVLIVYSRGDILSELDHRRPDDAGQAAHAAAVAEQQRIIAEERDKEPEVDARSDEPASD